MSTLNSYTSFNSYDSVRERERWGEEGWGAEGERVAGNELNEGNELRSDLAARNWADAPELNPCP